ncbi:MAG TPA: response regulator [Candidatus Sulfotelmatobacter sp.]|nr:response regulator [Candidatus Sulfotelmatobacter sp.]
MTRILIADDNASVRRALARLFKSAHNWEVIAVEDGQLAVSRALEARPDLVIVDLQMPVMDGLTAARQISEALPDTPIVMYTLHWTPALELAAQKCGVSRVVPKVQSDALLAVVEELLRLNVARPAEIKSEPLPPLNLPVPTGGTAPDPATLAEPENRSLERGEKKPSEN